MRGLTPDEFEVENLIDLLQYHAAMQKRNGEDGMGLVNLTGQYHIQGGVAPREQIRLS